MTIHTWIVGAIFLIYFAFSIPTVIMYWYPKYRVWKFGRQQAEAKTLSNGEVVIRTEEGIYFHAVNSSSIPILVNKEEGERLWNL